jgi:hypothetical protein
MLHGDSIRVTSKGVKCTHLCVARRTADEKIHARARMDGSDARWLPPCVPANPPNQVVHQNTETAASFFNLQNDMLMAHCEISLCTAKAHHFCCE